MMRLRVPCQQQRAVLCVGAQRNCPTRTAPTSTAIASSLPVLLARSATSLIPLQVAVDDSAAALFLPAPLNFVSHEAVSKCRLHVLLLS